MLPLLTVFLFSSSPIGGLAAAVGAGLGLGASPWMIFIVAMVSSVLPAIGVPWLCEVASRHKTIESRISKYKTDKATEFFSRYGVWGMALLGRFVVGPYAAIVTVSMFGVSKKKVFWVFMIASGILTAFFLAIALGGVELIIG